MGKPTGLGKLAQATMNFIQKVAMGRKYAKNATTKNNVFKLVEALLALANEEIAVPGDKLKATFNVEWGVKEDELRVSGKVQVQQKRNNKTQTVEKGTTKDDLWALVECFGKALELSQPKDEKNVDNAKRRGDAIQDVLDCLKDLGILVLEPSARNQGFWKFSLKLKHQTAEKKDNLEVIEEKWKVKIGSVTVEISHETPKPKEETINWQEICRQNLALQKELTTNLFTNASGMTPQLDGVYVPLAIVQRQKPKSQPRNQPEEKEKETEKLIPIAEERFFEDVLRQGKSDISQGRKIAIIGEPGAGKTTRLQKIADWILEQELGLPIWIDLAKLREQNICEYLEKVWLSRCQGEVTRGDLEAQISRVWLLLDGVDEMTHTQGMQQLGKDLLRTWVQAARVVVTCRVNVWEADQNAFSGFDVFSNLEFNAEQVTEYIRRWFAGMGDAATGESLESALAESENSRLKELIQNPLRLWMLCQIWSLRDGTLPDTQAKLYASFIKYFYRWKEQIIKSYAKLCGKTQGECQKLLHEALGELAKAAIDGKSGRFRLSYQLVSEYLGERSDETSLLSLALSLGWLNRVGIDIDEPEESVYAFYHATFQEYFAALAVDDWDYFLPRNHVDFPVVGKEYRIFEAPWKQVILLWLGHGDIANEEKEGFIEALVNFEDGCGEWKEWNLKIVDKGFYEYRAYFLAASCTGEFGECSQINDIISGIVKLIFDPFDENRQKLEKPHPQIVKFAKNVLKESFRPLVIAFLVEIIQISENESIRREADYLLEEIEPNHQAIIGYRKMAKARLEQKIKDLIQTIDDVKILLRQKYDGNEKTTDRSTYTSPDYQEQITSVDNFIQDNVANTPIINDKENTDELFANINSIIENNFRHLISIIEPKNMLFPLFGSPKISIKLLIIYLEQIPDQLDAIIELVGNFLEFICDCLWWGSQIPYPDFYRAWHGLTETQTSPLVQTLNLAQLPKLLQIQLTETNLHQNLQVFCIDTSKFIDTDNPALEIYEQFLDQNCPQRPNSEPETLPQLKSYWNRLRRDSDKHPILIFYQDPTSPAAQSLSPTFLNALTRFDGTICLITDSPHPPLQTFSPHDPDLLQSVVNWLKRVHLES
ncbi:MAG: NACHT domain-containing protein [Microcoleus anatoxicus]|uniref:NACHT C-terminal alpha/beta 1 domain-containing protein n=1 Tax=Microcoleus anatoxicus TaxID=2705319 RepID=UPI0036710648